MKNIGFIGCGNIASAMISGLTKSGKFDGSNIYAFDTDSLKLNSIEEEYSINVVSNNIELINNSDVVFLTVKPNIYEIVINEIKEIVNSNTIIIIVAAGISIEKTAMMFNKELKYVKAMPNTPSKVGEGITGVSYSEFINKNDKELVEDIFGSFGKYVELDENQFDAFTSICGSSPAFVYMFIDAIAEAGIIQGLPKELVYDMVSQAVLGSAKIVGITRENPEKLKNDVCTVGGATMEGVIELNKNEFKNIVVNAVIKTGEKSRQMNSN